MDSDLQTTHNGRKMLEDKPTQVGASEEGKKNASANGGGQN